MVTKLARELRAIPVNEIITNSEQPRKYFNDESLKELAESIKTVGIIQPLSVREQADGTYKLVSGERRLRAAMIAGYTRVPCVIIKGEEQDYDLISLIENVQREDINYIEEALAYKQIIERYNLTQTQLAEKIGKTQSTVANKMRLLKLGDEVIKTVLEYKLTERHARVLLSIPDTQMRLKAAEYIHSKGLNVRQSEELVAKLKDKVIMNTDHNNIKTRFNYRIYTNTIKQAYTSILNSGLDAQYDEHKYDDRVEVKIVIPIDAKKPQ